MPEFLQSYIDQIGGSAINIVGALAILVIGWIVALIIGSVVRGVLKRTPLDDKLVEWLRRDDSPAVDASRVFGKGAYYLVMLFVLVAFFQRLGLTTVTEPINALLTQVLSFAPRLLGAGLILGAAWIIASVLRFVLTKALDATNLDNRLRSSAGLADDAQGVASPIGDAVFWFVFLLFLPAVLGSLGMDGLVAPIQGMFDDMLAFVPNILGAGVILLVGWFAARIVRQVLSNVLAATGVDQFGDRLGLGEQKLSGLVGTVVHTLIMLQIAIAALDALDVAAISGPATAMLSIVWDGIPALAGAVIVLAVSYYIGRWVSQLVSSLLAGVGFNRVLVWLGVGGEMAAGQRTPSQVVGYLVLVGIMLFASVEAAQLLGLDIVSTLVTQIIGFAGQALVAVVIFGVGLWAANLARSVVAGTGVKSAAVLGQIARVAILVLVVAMALGQLGVAAEIVNLAFGLLLGAIAVAIALAFGLGSRDIAAKRLEGWLDSLDDASGD